MIQLMQGDCLEHLKKITTDGVQLVLTDIPYGEVNRSSGGLRNLNKQEADIVTFELSDLVKQITRITKGSCYVFCGIEQVSELKRLFVAGGMSVRLGIWEKTNPSPMNGTKVWLSSIECCIFARKPGAVFTEHCKSVVWRNPSTRSKIHPTQKPVALFERLILASSLEGQTVCDPFMGSGTTGVACKHLQRNFIGIEKHPPYFEAASQRINAEPSMDGVVAELKEEFKDFLGQAAEDDTPNPEVH